VRAAQGVYPGRVALSGVQAFLRRWPYLCKTCQLELRLAGLARA
jgi:hypothetical protein